MKKSITENEYLQLVGLLALAEVSRKRLEDIRLCVHELLGQIPDSMDGEGGHIDDAMWGDSLTAEKLLERMKIAVAAAPKAGEP